MRRINVYICPACGETWDINPRGGLIPSHFPEGAWYSQNPILDNCPGCFEIETQTKNIWHWRDESK